MQGRLLIVRLPARDRLGARKESRGQTGSILLWWFINNLPWRNGDEFRRIAERRLIDFPERILFEALRDRITHCGIGKLGCFLEYYLFDWR